MAPQVGLRELAPSRFLADAGLLAAAQRQQ
jgi:hypothetical protein